MLAAFRPGVAEEAWGRVFVIAALYWAFRRYARAQPAILAAAVLGTYWFAFIHVPFSPVAAVLFAAIQVLPITFLWLRRGLEVAIGFHVCLDPVRFLASYLAVQDVWFLKKPLSQPMAILPKQPASSTPEPVRRLSHALVVAVSDHCRTKAGDLAAVEDPPVTGEDDHRPVLMDLS